MEHSAGVLLYRHTPESTRSRHSQRPPEIEVFLGHFGGPYWQNKDEGAWTIPKGLIENDEDPFEAAIREFEEETGISPPSDREAYLNLGTVKQSSSKQVAGWAVESDVDPNQLDSNMFEMEWPPNSDQMQAFPELDRAAYFPLDTAEQKIVKGQRPFLETLHDLLARKG